MKNKLILLALFLAAWVLPSNPARAGGLQVFVGFRGGWAPTRFCPPVSRGHFPRLYACAPFNSSWGYFPDFDGVTYSPGFRTVSPFFLSDFGPTIIRVPPPVDSIMPIRTEPTAPFRWRR